VKSNFIFKDKMLTGFSEILSQRLKMLLFIQNRKHFLFSIAVVFLLVITATAQDSLNVSLINTLYGGIDGSINDLVIDENLAFFTSSKKELVILDISTPETPEFLGRIQLPENVQDIAVTGDYLYASLGEAGLSLVDISNPAAPRLIDTWEDWHSNTLLIENQELYIAYNENLTILDISDADDPGHVGSYIHDHRIRDIAISGDYLFLAARIDGFQVIDISDPSSPNQVQSVDERIARVERIVVDGQYAYTIGSLMEGGSFRIYDINNPADPEFSGQAFIIAAYDEDLDLNSLAISGNHAFIPFTSNYPFEPIAYGVFIIDISDHADPEYVTAYDLDNECVEIVILDRLAYLANDNTFHVINLNNPVSPRESGFFPEMQTGRITGIELSFHYAFISSRNGLSIVNVNNPAETEFINHVELIYCTDITINGNIAYLSTARPVPADEEVFFYATDIENPDSIYIHSVPGNNCYSNGISSDSQYIYIIGYHESNGLFIFDNSNLIGSIELAGDLNTVTVLNGFAFITGNEGLSIVNVEDPENPVETASLNEFQSPRGVIVNSNYAYLADGENGMFVINISNPSDPEITAHYESTGNFTSIYTWFDNAVLADSTGGIRILNVEYPSEPYETGYYLHEGLETTELRVHFPYVFTGAGSNCYIFDISEALNVENEENVILPDNSVISSVYPNPFNSFFQVNAVIVSPQPIQITIHNILGQQISSLHNGVLNPGSCKFVFDGTGFSSGVYFVKASVPGKIDQMHKVMLLR